MQRLYDTAHVAVVPLRWGAGVKGKVVEALRCGLPLVTTGVGAEGLPDIEQVLCIADQPDVFAREVVLLLESESHWHARSDAMQHFAKTFFSMSVLCGTLERGIGRAPRPQRA